ncbi:MAG TPA: hypothetical protein VNX25_02660 [Verrucomicrobiae bacterium]|nr:hypothetical protein [Verrucomicrobiae bacterium]
MNYRRRIGDILWHSSPSCCDWPEEQQAVRLTDDEYPDNLCPKCVASC